MKKIPLRWVLLCNSTQNVALKYPNGMLKNYEWFPRKLKDKNIQNIPEEKIPENWKMSKGLREQGLRSKKVVIQFSFGLLPFLIRNREH